jgi:pimeloyl-ACP methyl ester carboxylesterase
MSTVRAPEAGRVAPAQTRARYPDQEGYVERDGVRLFWERYGDGEPTLLLLPAWSIVHSRHWKAQIPYLARHFRVVAFDGRGNGRSDRPDRVEDYVDAEYVADAVAVLDATGTDRVAVVGMSRGGRWAVELAVARPERVLGVMLIDPAISLLTPIEDMVGWGLETTAETLILTQLGAPPATREEMEAVLGAVRCPVLVVHGEEDQVRPHATGVAVAELTGARLVSIAGGGHCPHARDPVRVNLLIREFVESLGGMAR